MSGNEIILISFLFSPFCMLHIFFRFGKYFLKLEDFLARRVILFTQIEKLFIKDFQFQFLFLHSIDTVIRQLLIDRIKFRCDAQSPDQ